MSGCGDAIETRHHRHHTKRTAGLYIGGVRPSFAIQSLLTNELLFQKQSINSIEMTHKRDKTFLIIQTFGPHNAITGQNVFYQRFDRYIPEAKKVSNLWKLIERRFHSTSFELRPEKTLKICHKKQFISI